jgi:hypothetical protein
MAGYMVRKDFGTAVRLSRELWRPEKWVRAISLTSLRKRMRGCGVRASAKTRQ